MKRLTIKEIKKSMDSMELEEACRWINTLKDFYGPSVEKLAQQYNRKLYAHRKELERLEAMKVFEKEAFENGAVYVGGIDEAGRGPLAGPVVAACVVLPKDVTIEKLNDSKKLSEAVREKLYNEIVEKAISYGVGIIEPEEIDEVNILNATKKAMKQAVKALKVNPDMLLIDAVELNDLSIKQKAIIKGDAKSVSIAAASIVAKVTRDRIMDKLDEEYKEYGFKSNKGYGTAEHIDAIKKIGISKVHRKSFTKNFVG